MPRLILFNRALQWSDAYAMNRCRRADRVDVRWLARCSEIESSAEDELGQMYSETP
jgi:hypothetical protein